MSQRFSKFYLSLSGSKAALSCRPCCSVTQMSKYCCLTVRSGGGVGELDGGVGCVHGWEGGGGIQRNGSNIYV